MVAPSRLGALSGSTSTLKPPASITRSSGPRSSSPTNPSRYWKPSGPRPAIAARRWSPARPCDLRSSRTFDFAESVTVSIGGSSGIGWNNRSDSGWLDVERQLSMCLAQRRLGVLRTRRAGKDEAQVARPLGQRLDPMSGRDADPHVHYARDGPGQLHPAHRVEPAAPGGRDHHDARSLMLALEPADVVAEHVPQDQLLERHAVAEAKGAR